MRFQTLTMLLAAATFSAGAAWSQDYPVVVELYTSQGCSSCPPADDMFRDLAGMEGVIALSLHVDYWDYIGWKDSFAQPAFTERQKAYAVVAGQRSIYTPQLVVGGLDHVVGADGMAVMDHIRNHAQVPSDVRMNIRQVDGSVAIQADAIGGTGQTLVVQLVRYMPEETVAIDHGENAGHTITYVNVVTDWDQVGVWTTSEPLDLVFDVQGPAPAVVIIQDEGPGRIRAAATLQ